MSTESIIYLLCIYFSLNNFNYPNNKLAIPSKLTKYFRGNPAKLLRKKNKTCLGFEVWKVERNLRNCTYDGKNLVFLGFGPRYVLMIMTKQKIGVLLTTDLKTEASFVSFSLPQKFCGNPAGVPRKSFVILMGVYGCLLFVFLLCYYSFCKTIF